MRSTEALLAHLRASGRKLTPQRLLVISLLQGDDAHPTAEAIHERATASMPTLSLKTVYSILHELEELGEVQSLALGTGASRYDPNVDPHHHLVCSGCGAVADVHPDVSGVEIAGAEARGFVVEATEVVFRGRCPACQAVAA